MPAPVSEDQQQAEIDVVIVGAGFSGLYLLHRLRDLGLSVRVLDAADGVGGTWYWNRYPGARCDVHALEYGFSFSPELDRVWRWDERYATQERILEYLNLVADTFDLRRDITFGTRVDSAVYDEDGARWTVRTDDGTELTSRFCVMATGCLSVPKRPDIPGVESFARPTYFTSRWPHEGVDLTGLRVGVIGTGSSAIQAIPRIAEQAARLTVFQRTPNFVVPAQNHEHGPRTYLGLCVAGFPNLFAVAAGPGSPGVLSNMRVSIEQHVDWITECIRYVDWNGGRSIEATEQAQDEWVEHVREVGDSTLFPRAASWYVGANVPGKTRVFMPYIGGVPLYRQTCADVAAKGYDGFEMATA